MDTGGPPRADQHRRTAPGTRPFCCRVRLRHSPAAPAGGRSRASVHALHDKVYRRDVPQRAWEQVRRNGGAAGIDGTTLSDIEDYLSGVWR